MPRKLLATKYSVDHQEIAEYFPLQTTIVGMLGTMEHLFGLVFTELRFNERERADMVWHDDV